MGLDSYAGPLTRFYAREWMTIIQNVAEQGIEVVVVRPGNPIYLPGDELGLVGHISRKLGLKKTRRLTSPPAISPQMRGVGIGRALA